MSRGRAEPDNSSDAPTATPGFSSSHPQATLSGRRRLAPAPAFADFVGGVEAEPDTKRAQEAVESAHQAKDVRMIAEDEQAASVRDEVIDDASLAARPKFWGS